MCLQIADESPDVLIQNFLPGMFTDAAPQAVRQELADIFADFHPVGFRLMSLSSAEVDSRDLLPHVAAPTLLLWGDDDRRSPLHIARQFQSAIPSAELVIVPNAGHVSNMEQPAAFNASVRRFCEAIAA